MTQITGTREREGKIEEGYITHMSLHNGQQRSAGGIEKKTHLCKELSSKIKFCAYEIYEWYLLWNDSSNVQKPLAIS